MIRKAKISDVGTIMTIINETVKEMKSYGNNQWDENYPNSETFINDIKNDSLYVYEEDNNIKGFICIVAHRIAVNTKFRNGGIATKLMSFCEELASKEGIRYIKTDTYSLNTKMNSLFKKLGYKFIGEVKFLSKEKAFYCYEKILK